MSPRNHKIDLKTEQQIWLNKLAFYMYDIKLMCKRLEEILQKNRSKEVEENVQYLQNQFNHQYESTTRLRHKLNDKENLQNQNSGTNSSSATCQLYANNPQVINEITQTEEVFNLLRYQYIQLLSKYM